jgi:hypothetical protein
MPCTAMISQWAGRALHAANDPGQQRHAFANLPAGVPA